MNIIINKNGDQKNGYTLTGSYNGIPFGVGFNEDKYQFMIALQEAAAQVSTMDELKDIFAKFEPLTQESYKELVETATPYILVNKSSNQYFLKWNNETSSIAMPHAFVTRILDSIDKKINPLPLIKCWVRFLRNPFFSVRKADKLAKYINKTYVDQGVVAKLMNEAGLSHEAAEARATTMQVGITNEGLIVGYKVSKEVDWKWELDADGNKIQKPRYGASIDPDTGLITYAIPEFVEDRLFLPAVQGMSGDEFYCGQKLGHFIKVGERHFLPDWKMVNTEDSQSCVKGLHMGGLDYIKGYQSSPDTITHNIFIDPAEIGAKQKQLRHAA